MTYLASRIFGTPLLIDRAKLDIILSALASRLGLAAGPAPPVMDLAAFPPPPEARASEDIAVIPIHGTLVKRILGMEATSGLTSYGEIAGMLDAAVADPHVTGILLDIDSPGGEASGSFEVARRVRDAASRKPVWAVANDSAYSAAYAIASSAQRLIVTETGGVGSIGVIALHVDQSVKDARDGYRFTAITAGAHKNDFSPHEPLSDTAKTQLRAEVDRLYTIFTEHVATMRGLDADAVRATEAGLFFGANAVVAGLADAVGTFDSALADFQTFLSSRRRSSSPARVLSRFGATSSAKATDTDNEHVIFEPLGVDEAAALVAETRRETTEAIQAQVEAAVQANAKAIAELCLIAGCPERAAEFIAAGVTEAQVRQRLIEARAAKSEAEEIRSTITVEAGTERLDSPDSSPIVAAVKKLTHKE